MPGHEEMPAGSAAAGRPTHLTVVTTNEQRGLRLDVALAAALPGTSRSQAQKLIRDGAVTLDGRPLTRVSEPVEPGWRLDIAIPAPAPAAPQPEPLPLHVLHEDADLIVIDKPAGLVVHPAAGHAGGTLVNALLYYISDLSGIGGELRPGIVHRLDKGTSGVMVVAKHDRAHHELTRQFSAREVDKGYVALVWGVLDAGRRIDAPIGRDPNDRQRMSVRARRGRTALTEITAVERLRGVTLVRLSIATGRTHQIRVHLQSIGHPVVGDDVYGGVRRPLPADLRALGRLQRPFLHAERLSFVHPTTGERLTFETPLPADLEDALAALRRAR